jgi:hypothetical protein
MAMKEKKIKSANMDLPETEDDKKHLEPDEVTMDLPDVEDIPGQEHVKPLPPGEMADVTISSADEEGEGIIGLHDLDDTLEDDVDTNVTREEREMLADSSVSMASSDDQSLKRAKVDNLDADGTPLNEEANQSGSDLDVPGSEADDENEEIGEEDEENNSYSLNDDKEDPVNTRQ